MSHAAIDNLMQAVIDRFAEEGDELRAVRKAKGGSVEGVDYHDDNKKCATGPYDVAHFHAIGPSMFTPICRLRPGCRG